MLVGTPLKADRTVSDIMSEICANQGIFVCGDNGSEAWKHTADEVSRMVCPPKALSKLNEVGNCCHSQKYQLNTVIVCFVGGAVGW